MTIALPEPDQFIVSAWTAGWTLDAIATDLGVTKGVVAGKVHRLGLPTRSGKPRKPVPHGISQRALLLGEIKNLRTALQLLVADVEQYEAWQRPCHALAVARAALETNP